MDPKMDSGWYETGEDPADEFDVSHKLLPTEIIWIMDEILCREMAWLRGFALFQTIFTSTHIHHLLREYSRTKTWPTFSLTERAVTDDDDAKYTHLCLYAFCMATIIQCDMNAELVASQQYYEEEDLNTQAYGLNLCSTLGDEECLRQLDQALDWLQKQETSNDLSEENRAITQRLRLRRTLMLIFMHGHDDVEFASFSSQLRSLAETHALGQTLERAFDPKAYHRLAIGGPTREPASLSFQQTIADLRDLHNDFRASSRLSELGPHPSAEALQRFLWWFASRSPQPSALARAKLQAQLFSPGSIFASNNFPRLQIEMKGLLAADERAFDFEALESAPGSEAFRRANTTAQFMQNAFEVDLSDTQRNSIKEGYLEPTMAWQCAWIILLGAEHEIYEEYEIGLMVLEDTARRAASSDARRTRHMKRPSAWDDYSVGKFGELTALSGLAGGLAQFYATLSRLGLIKFPVWCAETSRQRMWEIRLDHLSGSQNIITPECRDLEKLNVRHLNQESKRSLTVWQMLDAAEQEFSATQKFLPPPQEQENIGQAMFDLPPRHWIIQEWVDEIQRRKKVVVQARLEIHTLKRAVLPPEAGKLSENKLRPGYSVTVNIPTTAERLESDRKGSMMGHAWWVIPKITLREPQASSPLEKID
ncbi:MAG: hypothetical protein Q9159_007604 [Coniocarpon cinnabarinum]